MAKTFTFSVSTTATPIVTQTATSSVVIQEDPSVANWPTTDFLLQMPTNTDPAIRRTQGTSFEIKSPVGLFQKGATVGYVKTVTGTTTFQQYEPGF